MYGETRAGSVCGSLGPPRTTFVQLLYGSRMHKARNTHAFAVRVLPHRRRAGTAETAGHSCLPCSKASHRHDIVLRMFLPTVARGSFTTFPRRVVGVPGEALRPAKGPTWRDKETRASVTPSPPPPEPPRGSSSGTVWLWREIDTSPPPPRAPSPSSPSSAILASKRV